MIEPLRSYQSSNGLVLVELWDSTNDEVTRKADRAERRITVKRRASTSLPWRIESMRRFAKASAGHDSFNDLIAGRRNA